LRDGENLALRAAGAECFECHGTIGGTKIDADAELRMSHGTNDSGRRSCQLSVLSCQQEPKCVDKYSSEERIGRIFEVWNRKSAHFTAS
jgi:hypothetical protein